LLRVLRQRLQSNMTLIVGLSSIFGYGAIISDIAVTFQNGEKRDCLKKSFVTSQFVAAGFSGSVYNGYRLIQAFADLTHISKDAENTYCCDPIFFANKFQPTAKDIFRSAPALEQKCGSHLIVVGVVPNEDENKPIPKVHMLRLASPEFKPQFFNQANRTCVIGSGAKNKRVMRMIREWEEFRSKSWNAEQGSFGGWAVTLAYWLSRRLRVNPIPGVSSHLHVSAFTLGGCSEGNSDERICYNDETETIIKMPSVATRYDDFLRMTQAAGLNAACAIA